MHFWKSSTIANAIVLGLIFLSGCRTAAFDAEWTNDTNTWKAYSLNGVQFRIPVELQQMKMNSNTWWFVIKADQADNFGYGVDEAVQISCTSKEPSLIQAAEKRTVNLIEADGGRTSVTQKPVKGILYYAPLGFQHPAGSKSKFSDNIIDGSSFGYIFTIGGTNHVQICFIKNNHTPFPYEKWKPETEIFTDKERALIDKVVLSAQ